MKKKTASAIQTKREKKISTSFRISSSCYDVLYRLSERMNVSRGAILELAVYKLDQLDRSNMLQGVK